MTIQLRGLEEFQARNPRIDGNRSSIAIIDTGFSPSADSLLGQNNSRLVYAKTFTREPFTGFQAPDNRSGHGTAVTSVAASSDPRALGVAPGAGVVALKVFTQGGTGSSTALRDSLDWLNQGNASRFKVDVVNLSLSDGGNGLTPREGLGRGGSGTLASLKRQGVVVLAAQGNSFRNYNNIGAPYPVSDSSVLGVGAIDASGKFAPFSQRHPFMTTLVAPTLQPVITSSNRVSRFQGTSSSTPVVAGAVTLAQGLARQELGRKLTVDEFSYLAQTSGRVFYDPATRYNYTELDMAALGQSIENYSGNLSGASNYHAWASVRQIQEPTSGQAYLSFYVGRIGDTTKSDSVKFRFTGTAVKGADFSRSAFGHSVKGSTINFAPGQSYRQIRIKVHSDNLLEPTETIQVRLAPSGNDSATNPLASVDLINRGGSASSILAKNLIARQEPILVAQAKPNVGQKEMDDLLAPSSELRQSIHENDRPPLELDFVQKESLGDLGLSLGTNPLREKTGELVPQAIKAKPYSLGGADPRAVTTALDNDPIRNQLADGVFASQESL